MDDLRNHVERVLPADAETDEGEIRMFTVGRGRDLRDLELARDHLVAETRHDRRDPRQPVFPLVRDQDTKRAAQFLGFGLAERHGRPPASLRQGVEERRLPL